jgi:hypothetical protein
MHAYKNDFGALAGGLCVDLIGVHLRASAVNFL